MSRTAAIVALSEGYRAGDLVHVVPATLDGVDRGWWQGEALSLDFEGKVMSCKGSSLGTRSGNKKSNKSD